MSVALALYQHVEFMRVVDVEPNAGHFKDDERLAGSLHSFAMWQETVVAEAQWNEGRRTAQNAVAAAPVISGHEDRSFSGRNIEHAMQLDGGDQRNIAGNHDRCVVTTALAPCRRHCDGCRLALIAGIFDNAKGELCRHRLCA